MRRFALTALSCAVVALAYWGLQSDAFDGFLARHIPGLALRAGVTVSLSGIDFDLRGPSLEVRDLRVEADKQEWSATARRAYVRLHLLRSLTGTLHLDFAADSPNFQGTIPPSEKPEEKLELPNVVLDNVRISNGSFSAILAHLDLLLEVPSIEVVWVEGKGEGHVKGGGVRWKGETEPLEELSFQGRRRHGVLSFDRIALNSKRVHVSASGRKGLFDAVEATVSARVEAAEVPRPWIDAAGLRRYAPIQGAANLQGRVWGRLERPTFEGNLALSPGRFGPITFEGASLALEATTERLSFKDAAVRTSAGRARGVEGRLDWKRGLYVDARGEAVEYDLRPFMALFADGFFPVGVRATGTFQARGSLYPKLALDCQVAATGKDLDVTTEKEAGPVTWFALPAGKVSARCTVRDQEVVFGPTRIESDAVTVDVPSGRVEYEKGLEFATNVEIRNLGLIRQYLPEKWSPIDARGTARGRFGGPYDRLTFHYGFDLASAVILGEDLGRLTARADYDLKDLTLKGAVLEGSLGRLEAEGRMTLEPNGAIELDAEWENHDLRRLARAVRRLWPDAPEEAAGAASAVGKVVGTLEEPRFDGAVSAIGLRVAGAEVEEARAGGVFGADRWEAKRVFVNAYGGKLSAEGKGDRVRFDARGSIAGLPLERLEPLLGKKSPVAGVFSGSFAGEGPYRNPRGSLTGHLEKAVAEGHALGEADLAATYRDSRLEARATVLRGAATAEGSVTVEGQVPYAVDVKLRDLPAGALAPDLLPKGLGFRAASGRGRIEGAARAPRPVTFASWEGTVSGARYQALDVGPVDVKGRLESDRLSLTLRGWDGQALVEGKGPVEDLPSVDLSVSLDRFDLEHLSALGGVPKGMVSGKVTTTLDTGKLKDAQGWDRLKALRGLNLEARARDLSIPGLAAGPLVVGDADAKVRQQGDRMTLSLKAWRGQAAAEGTLPLDKRQPLGVSLKLDGFDLSRLSALGTIPAGRVSGAGTTRIHLGDLESRQGWERLQGLEGLTFQGRAEGLSVPGKVRLPAVGFQLRNPAGSPEVEVSSAGAHLVARVDRLKDLSWHAVLELAEAKPSAFFPPEHPLAGLGGTVTAKAEARGVGKEVQSALSDGEAKGLVWDPIAPSSWKWSARLKDGSAVFRLEEPRGLGGSGSWDRSQGLRASLWLRNVPLQGWVREGLVPPDLQGLANGAGEVRLPPGGKPSLTVKIDRLNASLPPVKVGNIGEVAASYEDGTVRVQALRLAGDGFDATVAGSLMPGKEWNLRVTGKGDLALLSRGVPKVRSSSGGARAEVTVRGPWSKPAMEGPLQILSGSRIVLEGVAYPFEDVDGQAFFDGSRGLVVEWIDAQFGEGRLHAEGFVGLEKFRPKTLRLSFEAREIAYELPKQVTYRFDADGLITGTPERPEVRGEVRLREFLDSRRLSFKTMILDVLKRRPREVSGKPVQSGVYLDVSVLGSNDITMENNLGDISLGVDLRLRGYLPQPYLLGRIETLGGKVLFRNQEYEVLRGEVDFLGETQPTPVLDLHARTTVRQYTVTVDVSGRLDDYKVELASSPAMQETDLVALLVVGSTSKEAEKGGGMVTATEATSLLTGQIQDLLETEVGDILGFDQFRIDPAYSSVGQTSVPRVTVGKSLSKSLSARYSGDLGGEAQQDVEVQYTLNPRVQVLGSWSDSASQTKGSFGGEVRFRFTFR